MSNVTRFGPDPLLDLEVANKRYVDSSGGGGTFSTQVDALTSNFTTVSTTITDIIGLTLTTVNRSGGTFMTIINTMCQNNTANAAARTAIENGAGSDEELMGTSSIPANDRTCVSTTAVGDLDGRVIQGRANVSAGTGSWVAAVNSNTILRLIETGGT